MIHAPLPDDADDSLILTLRNWSGDPVPQPVDLQIREQLARYLAGEMSLAEFRDWFGPVVWGIEQCADPTAEGLAYEVEGRLAEADAGRWNETTLRGTLAPLVEQCRVGTVSSVTTSSASTVIVEAVAFPAPVVGRTPGAASG